MMAFRARPFSFVLRPAENNPWRCLTRSFFSSTGGDGVLSFFDGRGDGEESRVYRMHLQCHRPPTVRRWRLPHNTCSLIGTVASPLKECSSRSGGVGAYTVLQVDKPPWSVSRPAFSPFGILLMMWGELAEVSFRYLKPNDFIYVSGRLSSYERVDGNGKKGIMHKVIVNDLNYVQQTDRSKASQNPCIGIKDDMPVCSSGDAVEVEYRDRLHLWQVFFANPREWWDNRQRKPCPSSPDFKHKHTHERLWLRPNDPPWIKKQLLHYDMETAGSRPKNMAGAQSRITELL